MSTHPLAAILAEHPTLTSYGFENPEETDPDEMAERMAELHKSEAAFDATCVWIREHLPPTPRCRGCSSSYYLKHVAEVEIGYLTNGLFIAAMIHCDHRFRQPGNSNPNAYFPLHKRKVTALDRRRDRIRQQQAIEGEKSGFREQRTHSRRSSEAAST